MPALRQGAQIIDPTFRDPESLSEQFQANIPGLTGNVPPRLTAFGEESQRPTPYSPVKVSAETQTEVDATLERVGIEVGFVGMTISGVKLDRDQQQEYQREAGQQIYNDLQTLISLPEFQALSEGDQADVVERQILASRKTARDFLTEAWNLEAEKELAR